ncbi:hypothetical protein WICPIJ_004093 [Wickerhamomyces pijperi]|uniref:TATA-binding protein interacting (TIP20) domain-containing protein n=1 Tax=Wickerhamomyces pijperi TaxID=599730 RepID=A0A9P8Q8K5_WICPI|nr:hypothetical protein WICPIJ_004093 [Wickerhamomyces pijperi]
MADQELDLVNKVELRIALADTDLKFQNSLDTYLAPLLLKLASPHQKVRQEIFKFVQHLVTRLNSSNICLPVLKLVQQGKAPKLPSTAESPLNVQLYSLLFAAKGIDSLNRDQVLEILPVVIDGMHKLLSPNVQARMFNIFVRLLKLFPRVYPDRTEDVEKYRKLLHMTPEDEDFLITKLEPLMILNGKSQDPGFFFTKDFVCNGVSADEVNFLTYHAGVQLKLDVLHASKLDVSKFLMIFDWKKVSLLVLLGAADIDVNVSNLNALYLKNVDFPLENEIFIDHVLDLVLGVPDQRRPAIDAVYQFDILQRILCPSKVAVNSTRALQVIEMAFSKLIRITKFAEIYTFIRNILHHSNNSQNTSLESLKRILQLLKNKIQSSGWPKAEISPGAYYVKDITDRNRQYELIGEILSKDSRLLEDLFYIEFLFDSLAGENGDVKSSVKDALSSISLHVGKLNDEAKVKLKKIIRNYMKDSFTEDQQTVAEVRFLSLKLLNTAFPFNDAEAKFLNVLGCSSKNRHDVMSEAKLGLNPYFVRLLQSPTASKTTSESASLLGTALLYQDFIDFEDYVDEFARAIRFAEERPSSIIHTVLDVLFNVGVYAIVSRAIQSKTTSVLQDEEWQTRIASGLTCDPVVITHTLKEIQSLSDLETNPLLKFMRLILREYINSFDPMHPFNPASSSELIPVFLSMIPYDTIGQLHDLVPELVNVLKKNDALQGNAAVSLPKIIGILSTHERSTDIEVSELFEYLLECYNNDTKGNKTVILMTLLSEIAQNLFARQRFHAVSPNLLSSFYNIIKEQLTSTSSSVPKIAASCLSAILKYGAFGPVVDDSTVSGLEDIKSEIIQTLSSSINKFGPAGYQSLALSTLSAPESIEEETTIIESKLLDSYETKDIDVLFSIGEALSIISCGWESKFLKTSPTVQDENFATNTLPRESLRIRVVLNHVLGMTKQTKPSIRRAGCIWLLALVQYCGESEIILSEASRIHFTFMKLLTDSDDVIQDSASRGLGIVYELGDPDLKETLIKSLLKSFADTTSGTKLLAGTINNDTELFEPGVLKTHDGSVSTYKDILSLASEVGDPSLVYKFMSLAKTSALWSSRRGIAFGLGNVMSKASLGKLLTDSPSMAKRLIPKLYRYRFDPNSLVSQSMDDIWKTLVPDSSAVIDAYSKDILNELLSSMGKNEWRVRQAATVALTDLLQILQPDSYMDQEEEIWSMGFRALDDIKESVRKAGANLTRSLSKSLVLTIKNDSSPERSNATLKRLLPFLLGSKGINSDSDDIRNFALETLVSLIKSAGKSIKPFIAELIEQFIQLMSTLEPQIMNYLALNADKYKVESDVIDSRRVQSLSSSPIMDTIERLIDLIEEDVIEDVVLKLRSTIKASVGLPSKFAGSKVIVSLVLRHYQIIKPYSDSLLLTCSARLNDNNNTVCSAYAVAAGYVARVSSIQSVVKYSRKIQTLYFGSESTPSTTRSKQTAGIASQAVAKHSGERFSEVATVFLPMSFICKNDEIEDVAKPFDLEWSDNTSGVGAVKLFLQEITDLAVSFMNSTDYSIRRVVLKSLVKAFDSLDVVTDVKVLESVLKSLTASSRAIYWNGKEHVIDALVSVSLKSGSFLSSNPQVFELIKTAIIKASLSKKKGYIDHTITALSMFVKSFPSEDMYYQAMVSFTQRLEMLNTPANTEDSDVDKDSDSDVDMDDSKKTKKTIQTKSTQKNLSKEKTIIDSLKSLSECFQLYEDGKYHRHTLELILKTLKSSFHPVLYEATWKTNLAIVECLKMVCTVLSKSSTFTNDSTAIELLAIAWKAVVENNFKSDCIENLRVQSVRLGTTITTINEKSLTDIVLDDLKVLLKTESSSIVRVEIDRSLER